MLIKPLCLVLQATIHYYGKVHAPRSLLPCGMIAHLGAKGPYTSKPPGIWGKGVAEAHILSHPVVAAIHECG